jgi:hypothetical protein
MTIFVGPIRAHVGILRTILHPSMDAPGLLCPVLHPFMGASGPLCPILNPSMDASGLPWSPCRDTSGASRIYINR